ncbi:MAG TPA: hypothetical protein PLF84_22725 [Bryobacteraceae bacterium]|nr:hypothetical protein [Bryobacteraceae bacterium]
MAANPPSAEEELAHTEQLLRTLTELKVQVVEIQGKIDEITQQLSERKGALANRPAPAPFGGWPFCRWHELSTIATTLSFVSILRCGTRQSHDSRNGTTQRQLRY